MKKSRKLLSLVLVLMLLVVAFCSSACGAKGNTAVEKKGTILWLTSLTAGMSYDYSMAYANNFLPELGYDLKVVIADMTNDPNANLNAVRNAMTKDVVGLITSVDGGLLNIMEEYPDLFVIGYNTDLRMVYEEGNPTNAVQNSDKYLGTICEGHCDGAVMGQEMMDVVVEKGYTKVATATFPAFAYPNLQAADDTFRELVAEYNKTAEKPIEIIGETKILQFAPLEESWFLEPGNGDLDAIVCFSSGIEFVYPVLKSAIINGTASPDTKLVTGGFSNEESVLEDIGGDGVIQYVNIVAKENFGYVLEVLTRAIEGRLYDDFKPERLDSVSFVMKTPEDVELVMTKSFTGSGDVSKIQVSNEEIHACTTHADLLALFASDRLSIAGIK